MSIARNISVSSHTVAVCCPYGTETFAYKDVLDCEVTLIANELVVKYCNRFSFNYKIICIFYIIFVKSCDNGRTYTDQCDDTLIIDCSDILIA